MNATLPRPTAQETADDARRLMALPWTWEDVPMRYRLRRPVPPAVADAIAPAMNICATRLPLLTITGAAGSGKTTMACRIAWWIAGRMGGAWLRPDTIRFRLSLKLGWLSPEDADALIAAPLVILDDFGGALTPAALTKALEVLESRAAWNRRTIVTTTMDLAEIAGVEQERFGREIGIASRLAGGSTLDLGTLDRRIAEGEPEPDWLPEPSPIVAATWHERADTRGDGAELFR